MNKILISIKDEYPLQNNKAQRILIPFSMSYLFETGILAVAVIKKKHTEKINLEKNMSGPAPA